MAARPRIVIAVQARALGSAQLGHEATTRVEQAARWPVVDARVKYIRPLRYAQPLVVAARISEWENRLKLDYRIRDAASDEVLTRAHTIQVAVDAASGEMRYQCPPVLWERLGVQAP